MRQIRLPLLLATCAMSVSNAAASDACSARAIVTKADVAVSDGSSFQTETYYASKESAAIRHVRNDGSTLSAVDGPFGWTSDETKAEVGPDFVKLFALGHQFHALLLDWESIMPANGEADAARRAYPYGGVVERLPPDARGRPAGMRFEFPETPPITTQFSEWRKVNGAWLPYRIDIDDGARRFSYRYSTVKIADRAPGWYFAAVPAPDLDAVQIYRLHRRLLTAHCLGDADAIAELSGPTAMIASRGEILEATREATRAQFKSLFDAVQYDSYADLKAPVIETSKSGDIGWAAVNLGVSGRNKKTGEEFEDQWAWFMTARKIEGEWRYVGNASNRKGAIQDD